PTRPLPAWERSPIPKLPLIVIKNVPAGVRVILQQRPGKRMIAVSHSEESTKRHNRVCDLPGSLVDHQVVDRAQPIASVIEDVSAPDFFGGDKGRSLLDAVHEVFSLSLVQN